MPKKQNITSPEYTMEKLCELYDSLYQEVSSVTKRIELPFPELNEN